MVGSHALDNQSVGACEAGDWFGSYREGIAGCWLSREEYGEERES